MGALQGGWGWEQRDGEDTSLRRNQGNENPLRGDEAEVADLRPPAGSDHYCRTR